MQHIALTEGADAGAMFGAINNDNVSWSVNAFVVLDSLHMSDFLILSEVSVAYVAIGLAVKQ